MSLRDLEELGRNRESWIFLVFALWGGLAHYIGSLRGSKRPFSLFELAGDLTYSGFAGVIAISLSQHFGLSDWATGAVSGMAGHMGSRSIFLVERAVKRKWFAEED